MYAKHVKRWLDFTISLIAIVLLLPVYLLIALLVRINMGSPVMFTQDRVGMDEIIFKMYKFRTMTDARDSDGNLLPDEQRQTRFGSMLRSSSLDELPELFNILKGDLSIVGPRPLLVCYLPYYTAYERKRHQVRGGLTQPEVLYGLVNPTWDQQLQYEAEYAQHVTFVQDVKICLATFGILWKRFRSDYGSGIRRPLDEERGEENRHGSVHSPT